MKGIFLLPLALLGGVFGDVCSPRQEVFLDQSADQSGMNSPSDLCAGVIDSINIDLESGTEGGVGHIGTPLVFSADPRDRGGVGVTFPCRPATVSVVAIGSCTAAPQQPTDSIVATPNAVGICQVQVTAVAGKTEISQPVTIE